MGKGERTTQKRSSTRDRDKKCTIPCHQRDRLIWGSPEKDDMVGMKERGASVRFPIILGPSVWRSRGARTSEWAEGRSESADAAG